MQIIILSKHYHPYSDNDVITKEEKPLKDLLFCFFSIMFVLIHKCVQTMQNDALVMYTM